VHTKEHFSLVFTCTTESFIINLGLLSNHSNIIETVKCHPLYAQTFSLRDKKHARKIKGTLEQVQNHRSTKNNHHTYSNTNYIVDNMPQQ